MNSEKCKSFFGRAWAEKKKEEKDNAETLRSQRSAEKKEERGMWRHYKKIP
jgi:hypothetical protein